MRASRSALTLCLLLSGVLVLTMAAPALAATTKYRINFRLGEFFAHDDNGDGDSDDLGDYEIGSFVLKKGGEKVGHLNFRCDVTEVSPPRDLCWTAIRIKGKGQVIAHGSQAANSESFTGAITGGTGAYRGAGGVIKIDFGRKSFLTIDTD